MLIERRLARLGNSPLLDLGLFKERAFRIHSISRTSSICRPGWGGRDAVGAWSLASRHRLLLRLFGGLVPHSPPGSWCSHTRLRPGYRRARHNDRDLAVGRRSRNPHVLGVGLRRTGTGSGLAFARSHRAG
jgi:hypothetical protein